MKGKDWLDWQDAKDDEWAAGVAEHRDGDLDKPWVGKPVMEEAASQLAGFGAYLDEHHRQTGEDVEPLQLQAWSLWGKVRALA